MGKKPVPGYRRQKRASGDLAFIEVEGVRHYLGRYGTQESRTRYHRFLAEWEANGRHLPVDRDELDVDELIARFLTWALSYYRDADGNESSEPRNYRTVLKIVRELYGDAPAAAFGPRCLKTVRHQLMAKGLSRNTCNQMMRRIRRMFRWAAEEELISASVHGALAAVRPLRRGRSEARETPPVCPVPLQHVEKTLPYLSRQLAAVVELQRLTGARSGEILPMRPGDLDREGEVWLYTPPSHKTAYRGHARTILVGPNAQKLIDPFLRGRGPREPLFSPREAEEERRAKATAERKTPAHIGNRPGTNRTAKPRRPPLETYTPTSYGRAVTRACELAGVPHWHPHQLRHARATEIRKLFGIEVARVVLGHRGLEVTEVYAQADIEKAREVMQSIG